jgi:APA family basic amino acid/polyamine antiporter
MSGLRRALGPFDLTMIAIGSTIGSGIFLTPSSIAQALPSPWFILAAWVLGGCMALAGALTFAELGGMMPQAGGMYVYLTEAYGGLAGFLFGWAYALVVNTGGVAALCVAFATYAGAIIPLDPTGRILLAVGGLAVVTVVNVLGVKQGGIFADIFTGLKLLGIGLVIVAGIVGGGEITGTAEPGGGPAGGWGGAFALAMVGVLWSYGGWQHTSFTAGEAVDPARTVPRAMVVGAAVVVGVYLLTNVAYMRLLPVSAIAGADRLAVEAVEPVFGATGGLLIALAICISVYGTAGIYTLTAPRIYFAMAADGVFFRSVAAVHPRFRTPSTAIVLQSLWAAVLILFWGTFEDLISYVVFTDWIFFAMTAAAVMVLRRRRPDAPRPYRVWGYPFTPLFFIAVAVWFVMNTLVQKPEQALAGLLFLALGVPAYLFWKRRAPGKTAS